MTTANAEEVERILEKGRHIELQAAELIKTGSQRRINRAEALRQKAHELLEHAVALATPA